MKDKSFWHEKWVTGKIGFHQNSYHHALAKYWPQLRTNADETVLVPLCGKSKDMLYLREQGHKILGIELSEIAIKNFSQENNIAFNSLKCGGFIKYEGSGYKLLVGDFFKTTKEHCKNIAAVYDRAALIALPKNMRADYANHLRAILPKGTHILLITLAYNQTKMDGPPFNVDTVEVEKLFGKWCQITPLEQCPPEKFRGINARELIFHLTVF